MKQVQSSSTKYDGILRALGRMYTEEGVRGFFKGNGTNVARIAPFSAIQFFSFDLYKGVRRTTPLAHTTKRSAAEPSHAYTSTKPRHQTNSR